MKFLKEVGVSREENFYVAANFILVESMNICLCGYLH